MTKQLQHTIIDQQTRYRLSALSSGKPSRIPAARRREYQVLTDAFRELDDAIKELQAYREQIWAKVAEIAREV